MSQAAPAPRSGRQLRITASGYEAVIASIGATLRMLRHEERDLVVPFDADEVRPAHRGATLAPWPNRIVDGRYSFHGIDHQLPLTEPTRGHALHGLVVWNEFTDRVVEDDRVVLATVIEPRSGYPFRVEVEVEYRVDENGLHQSVTAHNRGADAAPWGTGPHPYLVAATSSAVRASATGAVDAWTLLLPASEVLRVTPDRLSPIALEPVDAHPQWDFRAARRIGDTFIDHAFTALERDVDGVAEVQLRGDGGAGAAISFGPDCPWVQVHTADTPDPATDRVGLAVEPMTCAPDAFNSGAGLLTLAPDATHTASWSIRAL